MNAIKNWLERQIKVEFPEAVLVACWKGDRHLKHFATSKLSGITGASEWEFTPDFVAVFEIQGTNNLAFMNFTDKTLGLTELGELHVYAKIAAPLLAIQATVNGLSRDLYSLLLDQGVKERLLGYGSTQKILVGQWDQNSASIPEGSYFPPRG